VTPKAWSAKLIAQSREVFTNARTRMNQRYGVFGGQIVAINIIFSLQKIRGTFFECDLFC